MQYRIHNVQKKDYLALIDLWEKSVRSTHNFLPDKDINQLKLLILNKYFDEVLLKCIKNKEGKILGFCGIASKKIEMLFVSPETQGQGIGSTLCRWAVANHQTTEVDVNEQNPQAKLFYEKMGFKVISRSELDGQGMPYPILHMKM